MSWSYQAVGTPEKVAADLDRAVSTYTDQSKIEFADAMPHLKGLLSQVFGQPTDTAKIVKLKASGSGSARLVDGTQTQLNRVILVELETLYNSLV